MQADWADEADDRHADKVFFYDLEDGFVILRRFGSDGSQSRSAQLRAREQLPRVVRDTGLERGSNHFHASVPDGGVNRLSLLRLTIFVEDSPVHP